MIKKHENIKLYFNSMHRRRRVVYIELENVIVNLGMFEDPGQLSLHLRKMQATYGL
jgi:hypothetical protein